jgi:hypothetical protein
VIPIRERPPSAGATSAMKKRVFRRLPVSDNLRNSERFKTRSFFLKKKRYGLSALKKDCYGSAAGINRPAGPFPWRDGG